MKYNKITYKNHNISFDVYLIDGDFYLTQKELMILFQKSRPTISRAISELAKNIEKNSLNVKLNVKRCNINSKSKEAVLYELKIINYLQELYSSSEINQFIDWIKSLNVVKNEIIPTESDLIRFDDGVVSIDVRIVPNEETIWLNQKQIAELYQTTQPNISMHIKNILDDKELEIDSVHKDFLYTAFDGKQYSVDFYNLDMVLAIGYRTKTKRAIEFRKWASRVLKDYLMKGYAFDEKRIINIEENFISLSNDFNKIKERVDTLEENQKTKLPDHYVIYENQKFEGREIIKYLIGTAKKKIVLIDPYIDISVLDAFKCKDKLITLFFIGSKRGKITKSDIDLFNNEYGNLTYKTSDKYHDRFLIIDDIDFYDLGSSINYLGNRFSIVKKIIEDDIKEVLLKRVMDVEHH